MATNLFPANIYYQSLSSGARGLNPYQTIAFPATGGAIIVKPFTGSQPVQGVTVNSIISVLPSGLVVPPGDYYSDSTVAQIIALANA